ncbi:hypothetical protein ILUMI_06884 [Ignelater luminosus]|uniref:Coiled-coil domain-containing protein n=1 Tax=Ignelater luminosus TaxID=2038154 RepID=A0A8K0DEL6_IGNLU|nr:hypothetical protein ILUMI_06884 [Ignelater luminosus]
MVVSADSQDNQKNYFQERKTLSSENLSTFGIVRKYMNGAVCVESAVDITNNNLLPGREKVFPKRISCSCSSEHFCPIHEKDQGDKAIKIKCSSAKKESKIEQNFSKASDVDLKLSIASLVTASNSSDDLDRQRDTYKKWIIKKNEEKKRIEENKIYLKEVEEQEKQKRLEQERENFKRWLLNKKKEQERIKLEKEKQLEQEKEKEAEKERRNLECKLRFQLWLKKKEEAELEKKLKAQIEQMKVSGNKQQRTQMNEKAYKTWLETSKTKPKPIPLGRGLESLRSSMSVTYINPIPWTPNIEKPASQ